MVQRSLGGGTERSYCIRTAVCALTRVHACKAVRLGRAPSVDQDHPASRGVQRERARLADNLILILELGYPVAQCFALLGRDARQVGRAVLGVERHHRQRARDLAAREVCIPAACMGQIGVTSPVISPNRPRL